MTTARSRAFDRRAVAEGKRIAAKRLDRLGLSDVMWNALQTLHLSRLERERGHRAPAFDRTLDALYSRGLATWSRIEGEDPRKIALWRCTEEGAALVKKGRPE